MSVWASIQTTLSWSAGMQRDRPAIEPIPSEWSPPTTKGKLPFAKPSCTLSASWRQVVVTSSRYFMVGSVFLFSGLGGMPISEIPLTWLPHRSASDEILFLENAIGPR